MDRNSLLALLRRRQGSKSLRQYARELGISAPYLYDVMRGSRNPGPKLLDSLGLERCIERRVSYRRVPTTKLGKPSANTADLDFHPVEIRGEPLSATILRERR